MNSFHRTRPAQTESLDILATKEYMFVWVILSVRQRFSRAAVIKNLTNFPILRYNNKTILVLFPFNLKTSIYDGIKTSAISKMKYLL